ncbi:MAG: hypothetical protein ACXWZM_08160 [Solirubrobacterales bacterium]
MRNRNRHGRFGRGAIVCALAGLLALAALAAASATGSTGDASRAKTKTVYIKLRSSGVPLPHFVAPNTIRDGDTLRIVSKTNAREVGPHTFSLVTRKAIPRTKPERKKCAAPHHICFSIAIWHGVTGPNSPPTKNPVNAGPDGWSTLGNLERKGDSWYTGFKHDASFEQELNFDPSKGQERLSFFCAVHPWMHDSIKVLP